MDASHPDNLLLHHFSIGSRASRVAFALPDRMALIYHNITPPEYFVGVHDQLVELCWKGRRELGAYVDRCDLALGDSEFNRQELRRSASRDTGVLPVVPDFSHLDAPRDSFIAGRLRRRVDEHAVRGPHHPEQADREPDPHLSRLQARINQRSRLLLVGVSRRLREVPDDAPRTGRARWASPTCT